MAGLIPLGAKAQRSDPDIIKAHFSNEKIQLDGSLTEQVWKQAGHINNFTQREQNEGTPSTEETRVEVVYNKNEIIFGISCFDSEPDKIVAQQMNNDFSWESDDNFEIMISTFNDNRSGYLFVTNPNGAMADAWIDDEGRSFNKEWNGIWDVAVERNSKGWFIELKIPFSTLKFPNDSVQLWAINFERNISRKKEQLLWQGWSRIYELETIAQGGKLTGIENIKPVHDLNYSHTSPQGLN